MHRASPQAIIYPLELIRTRLAVSPTGTYAGISHCVRQVLQHEGWRAFYRGMVPSMVRPPLPGCMNKLRSSAKVYCTPPGAGVGARRAGAPSAAHAARRMPLTGCACQKLPSSIAFVVKRCASGTPGINESCQAVAGQRRPLPGTVLAADLLVAQAACKADLLCKIRVHRADEHAHCSVRAAEAAAAGGERGPPAAECFELSC